MSRTFPRAKRTRSGNWVFSSTSSFIIDLHSPPSIGRCAGSDTTHDSSDLLARQDRLHEPNLTPIDLGGHCLPNLGLKDVVDRKPYLDPGQRPREGRVAVDDRLRGDLGALRVWRAKDDHHVVLSLLLHDPEDRPLA